MPKEKDSDTLTSAIALNQIYRQAPSDPFEFDRYGVESPSHSARTPSKAVKVSDRNIVNISDYKFIGPNGELWTGRGRKPKWFVEAIRNGANYEDFLNLRYRNILRC